MSKEIQDLARVGIMELLRKLNSTRSTTPKRLVGTCPISDNTERENKKMFHGLYYYCSLIGDYESMLMLEEYPPEEFCPSMSPHTIADFIRFKRQPAGSIFIRFGENGPAKDVFGTEICAQGG